MELWVKKKTNLVYGEKGKKQMCTKKQPWRGHGVGRRETVCEPWLLIAFPFPDCDSLKEIPQGLKIPVIFIISTTIKKINMTQGNARFCNKKFQ